MPTLAIDCELANNRLEKLAILLRAAKHASSQRADVMRMRTPPSAQVPRQREKLEAHEQIREGERETALRMLRERVRDRLRILAKFKNFR